MSSASQEPETVIADAVQDANDEDDEGEDVVEDEHATERTRLKVFKNGRFAIIHKEKANNSVDISAVVMGLDYIWEKNAEGEAVGIKQGPKSDGAEQNHGDRRLFDRGMRYEVHRNVTIGEARGHQITYRNDLEGIGTFRMDLYLLEEAGDVGPDLTDANAARWGGVPGTVKFNFALENWTWCGTGESDASCGGKEGQYIDVQMRVQARSANFSRKSNPRGRGRGRTSFELGDAIDLDLTNEVLADGSLAEMPEGYPMMEERERRWRGRPVSVLTFRFPKFNEEMIYDPIVEEEEEEGGDGSDGGEDTTTSDAAFRSVSACVSVFALITAVFA